MCGLMFNEKEIGDFWLVLLIVIESVLFICVVKGKFG